MRLETFAFQRYQRYKFNVWRWCGYAPSAGLLVFWIFENGFYNFNTYVLNPPPSGVKKREEGEDIED
jgi:hypothetical protein